MRIYSQLGDIPFKQFLFPDSQPHFSLLLKETREEALVATIETAITNSDDLVTLLLAKDTLSASGYRVNLDIRYLLGARMDRRIDANSPNTLEVISRVILGSGFQRIRVLDCHSDTGLRLLNAENLLPRYAFNQVLSSYPERPTIVAPDKGAVPRVMRLNGPSSNPIISCTKYRDPATGRLQAFSVEDPSLITAGLVDTCLIADDICDGGGTFTGLAQELRHYGVKKVDLFVTHGIFSKNLPLAGIDQVYTTDSLPRGAAWYPPHQDELVVIPVSMEKMKGER